jgi:hypothetical protein
MEQNRIITLSLLETLYIEYIHEKNKDVPFEDAKNLVYKYRKYHWKCSNVICSCHVFTMTMEDRLKGRRCPFCVRHVGCKHDNIKVSHPLLVKEWWYHNTTKPHEHTCESNEEIKWICTKRDYYCHIWSCPIRDKISGLKKCPGCYPTTDKANYVSLRKEK